eukprot:scaffold38274_cov199-Amphora_coffeaeformis.AAC.1
MDSEKLKCTSRVLHPDALTLTLLCCCLTTLFCSIAVRIGKKELANHANQVSNPPNSLRRNSFRRSSERARVDRRGLFDMVDEGTLGLSKPDKCLGIRTTTYYDEIFEMLYTLLDMIVQFSTATRGHFWVHSFVDKSHGERLFRMREKSPMESQQANRCAISIFTSPNPINTETFPCSIW